MEKVGGRNFGEFIVIRQIRQRFPPPKFPSIWYICIYIYLIQNTFGVKKARPSKVESYLEVNT